MGLLAALWFFIGSINGMEMLGGNPLTQLGGALRYVWDIIVIVACNMPPNPKTPSADGYMQIDFHERYSCSR